MPYFLISAVGCPPLDPPYNAWLQGDRDHAIVQCNETDEAWFLTCKGTRWIGLLGNCTVIGGEFVRHLGLIGSEPVIVYIYVIN